MVKRKSWEPANFTGMKYDHSKPDDYPVPPPKTKKPDPFKTLAYRWTWGWKDLFK